MLKLFEFENGINHEVYKSNNQFKVITCQIKTIFQIILSLAIMWSLCAILTATDTFPEGSPARTKNLTEQLAGTNWFYFPYPGFKILTNSIKQIALVIYLGNSNLIIKYNLTVAKVFKFSTV